LYLTFLFELCLLGLAGFLGDILFWDLFGNFMPKGENVGPKQANVSKVEEQAMCEHMKRRSKRGKFDLGGVWMMVSIQATVVGSNFVNFCKFMFALLVLS
jgi:hypothetical protein